MREIASGGAALTTQASLFAGLLPIQLINLLNSIGDIVRVKDDAPQYDDEDKDEDLCYKIPLRTTVEDDDDDD